MSPDMAVTVDLVRRAIELVQRLDPMGVCARDLRECLALQIAAQQREFEHLYGKQSERLPDDEPDEDPHGGFRAGGRKAKN